MTGHLPRILAVLPGFTASTLMDVVKPLMSLEHAGKLEFRVVLEQYMPLAVLDWADLVVFCRNTEPRYRKFLDGARMRGLPLIYDLDDNLFEIPINTQLGVYHRDPQRLHLLTQYLKAASLVRVYSTPLLEQVRVFTSQVKEVVAPIDWVILGTPQKRQVGENGDQNREVKIVYVTSRINDHLFAIFSEPLLRILDEFPDQVTMYFWGFIPPEFQGLRNVRHLAFVRNYNDFLQQFSKRQFDIGLAPLLNDTFHRSKTNNKFREYGACGIAGIYSNVEVYSHCVENEQTGLVVSNDPQAWYHALRKLVTDAPLRQQIGDNARKVVQQQYAQGLFQKVWLNQITNVLSATPIQQDVEELVPNQNAASSLEKGYHILGNTLKRAVAVWRTGGVKMFASTLGLLVFNLWLLLKINLFKRL
jgi:glycosyltransferase involved in cell wall biosynthesis